MTTNQTSLEVLVGTLQGEISGLKSRMDDMHRLMMVLIGIAGGGLVSCARESRAAIAEVDGGTTAILLIWQSMLGKKTLPFNVSPA